MTGHDDTADQPVDPLAHLRELAAALRDAQAQTDPAADAARRDLEQVLIKAWNKGRGMSQPALGTAIGHLYSQPMLSKIVGKRPRNAPRRRGTPASPEQLAELAAAAEAYRLARDAAADTTRPTRQALIDALVEAWDNGHGITKNRLLQAIDYMWSRQWLDKIVGTVPGQHGAPKGRWSPTSRADRTPPPPTGDAP